MHYSNAFAAKLRLAVPCVVAGTLAAGCAAIGPGSSTARSGQPPSEAEQIAQMQIVDCLLPGQLRSLGNTSYLTPRRPIKTTAADCNTRGGEYVAYDRADYKTALKVWMSAAQAGDARAQVNVGEIFEKGKGTEPNYKAAVIWYRKAAEQGNKEGLFNLGTMYEQGKGVAKNRVKALNLYRRAWGLPADSVIFEETARAQRQALKSKLNGQLQDKQEQIKALQQQIASLQSQVQAANRQAANKTDAQRSMQKQVASLKKLVDSLSQSRAQTQQKLASLDDNTAGRQHSGNAAGKPLTREPEREANTAASSSQPPAEAPTATQMQGMDFGRYYALVIGDRNYAKIRRLDTPANDAKAVAKLLRDKYGFQVQTLIDADRLTMMKAVNNLQDKLGKNDNLLIYYAGHGDLVKSSEREVGYWLPTNADPPPDDSHWVPNAFITGHLGRFKAKRVLVIADSCYGGLLSSAPGYLMFGNDSAKASKQYIRYKLPRRSRLLLSSGGNQPVIDNVGDRHSIFAAALLKTLRNNSGIMTTPELFAAIKGPVQQRSAAHDFSQTPVLKTIKGAGHEVGGFFFVPRQNGGPVAQR